MPSTTVSSEMVESWDGRSDSYDPAPYHPLRSRWEPRGRDGGGEGQDDVDEGKRVKVEDLRGMCLM